MHTQRGIAGVPILIVAVLLLVAGCTQVPTTPKTETATTPIVAASPGATGPSPVAQTGGTAGQAEVKEQDLKFVPATITIAPGTKVVWTNTESIPHTVTSGKPGGSDIGSMFDQSMPNQGDTFSFSFQSPGVFDYFCRYHLPGMVGQVIVQEPGAAVKAASPGPTSTPLPLPERFTTVGPGDVLPGPFNANVAASGLDNPRGFTWGPDGALYVAESGISGAQPITGTGSNQEQVRVLFCEGWKQTKEDDPPPENCPQVDPQYLRSGRISRIAPDGTRSTVVDGLPVIVGMFGFSEGPQSVAFVGDDLYVLIIHALGRNRTDGFNTGVYRVNPDKSGILIAALDEYNREHPPAVIPPDFDLSEPHDMISLNRKLYVSDGNAGVIFESDPAAPEATRTRHLADLSGLDGGHPVLTGLSAGPDGDLYVTYFSIGGGPEQKQGAIYRFDLPPLGN